MEPRDWEDLEEVRDLDSETAIGSGSSVTPSVVASVTALTELVLGSVVGRELAVHFLKESSDKIMKFERI